jgi:hypothetical protein
LHHVGQRIFLRQPSPLALSVSLSLTHTQTS